MRAYEVVYIIKPNLEDEAIDQVVAKYENVITSNGGEIQKTDRWGKRRLAYEIDDFSEGYYVVVNLTAEPAVVRELERIFKISDDVIRYLIVRQDS